MMVQAQAMVLQPGNKLPGNPAANLRPHTDTACCCTTLPHILRLPNHPHGLSRSPSLLSLLHSLTPLAHTSQCPMGAVVTTHITTWLPAHCRNTMMTTATAHVWRHRHMQVHGMLPVAQPRTHPKYCCCRARGGIHCQLRKLHDGTTRIVWSHNPLSVSHQMTHTGNQFNSQHTVESGSLTECRSS